jgi:hypothetical protein
VNAIYLCITSGMIVTVEIGFHTRIAVDQLQNLHVVEKDVVHF